MPCREIRETVNTIELNFYQEYSITLNAFFVVRWTDKRMIIDKEKMDMVGNLSRDSVYYVNIYDVHNLTIWKQFANFFHIMRFSGVLTVLLGLLSSVQRRMAAPKLATDVDLL